MHASTLASLEVSHGITLSFKAQLLLANAPKICLIHIKLLFLIYNLCPSGLVKGNDSISEAFSGFYDYLLLLTDSSPKKKKAPNSI